MLAIVIGAALTLRAAEVTEAVAKEAVAGWASLQEALTAKERFAGATVAKVETFSGMDGLGVFHVISFEGGGFAVTSGDTEMTPILAYSEDGEFVANDENPLWVMLTRDVAGRAKRLSDGTAQSSSAPAAGARLLAASASQASQSSQSSQSSSNASAWARLREAGAAADAAGASLPANGRLLMAANPRQGSVSDLRVAPLCPLWNQHNVNSEPVYNYYTPSNYLSGCVATAMAEVMHAFKWPQGKVEIAAEHSGRFRDDVTIPGTVVSNVWHIGGAYGDKWEYPGPAFGGPYDWESMVADPLAASNAGTLTETQRQAIGLLCRDCGISVNMNYDIGGSGSSTRRIGPQLVSQFGYANAAVFYNPGVGSTYDQQMNAILPSLDMGSPCAIGLSSHSIVADGYGYTDSRVYVHFNYGWGSGSGSTAWYTPALDAESDADYPVIGSMVYNIWTPEAGIAAGSAIVKGVVLADDGATPVASAAVTATDAVSGASVAATAGADGAFTFYLPPGDDWTLAAASGGATASRSIGEVGAATTDARPVVYNRRRVALVLGSTAGGGDAALLHRWSFNGETDAERLANTGAASSDGTAATVCGSDPAAVVFADGTVSLSGGGNGTGYLTLGTNTIPDTATVEIWAGEDAVKFWSRVFDYGADTANYLMLSWTYGSEQRKDRLETRSAASGTSDIDGAMAPYTPGTMYHIAVTLEKNDDDGSTLVRVMRRDAKTGELQRMGSRTVAGFAASSLVDAAFYLGHSQFADDADANATYDEVRVWSGVLSNAQLAANAVAGPDVADLDEAVRIAETGASAATVVGGHTATRRGRIAYGAARSGMGQADVAWPKIALSSYTDDGEHDISELSRAASNVSAPDFLEKSQVRYDGWVEVTEDQAGWWTINQKFDDYFVFALDGDFAVFNHTYNDSVTSRVRVTEGWHRFTVVCGDTYGGFGATYAFSGHYVPFTVSVNGGEEMSFTSANFAFGTDSGVVTLSENADWTELGAVTLSPGAVLDLNGHTLRVADIAADGVGVVVTNSAARGGRVVFAGDPAASASASTVRFADGVVREAFDDLGWVNESAETAGFTGEWSPSVAYDGATGRAELSGDSVFEPFSASGGNVVTMTTTVTFDCVPQEEVQPKEGAQGGLWIGTNGCFQVWTRGKSGVGSGGVGELGWIDVEAEGVMPQVGVEYTFRFTFDYTSKTYGVEVQTATGFTRLREKNPVNPANPVQNFPLATPGSKISRIRFDGSGAFRSLVGEWAEKVRAFMIHIL